MTIMAIIWILLTVAVVAYAIGKSGPTTPVIDNEDAMKQRMRGGERL